MNFQDGELLVIGASGHSARYFFGRLEEENYEKKIKCLVRRNSQIEHLRDYKLNLEFILCDIENIDCLKSSMEGVKTVLHIASIKFSKQL